MFIRQLYKFVSIMAVTASLLVPVAAHATAKTGQPLPHFSVTTPSGQEVSNLNYGGRVLLLVFSTDYCSACKNAIPAIGKLAGRYAKQGFHVLGLFSGFNMENDELKKYMKTYGVSYPMAYFDESLSREEFGMLSVPYSLLVDKKGMVAGLYYGYSEGTIRKIEEQVKKLLAE